MLLSAMSLPLSLHIVLLNIFISKLHSLMIQNFKFVIAQCAYLLD